MNHHCCVPAIVLALCWLPSPAQAGLRGGERMPMLSTRGSDWVDDRGKTVVLRGCNLGNWLVQEMWMHAMGTEGIPDQYTLEQVLTRRFGRATKDRLMDTYRANYITARDFQTIKSFGMNVVRLPILYTLLEDDDRPFQLKPDAWVHIDRALALAEKEDIHVILDLHGAPGGQNPWQHCGRENQEALWGNQQNKRRTVWLWRQMAARYRGRHVVAAYDLLNEPYTAPKAELKELMLDIYRAIREVDPDHIIIFPGLPDGFEFYGKPAELGLTNMAFTAHFYPGLFGWGEPTREVHEEWLARGIGEWRERVKAAGVPLLVGEMNVVLGSAGGAEMTGRSFDAYTSVGWAVTMWAYKTFSREGGFGDGSWGMVTNLPGEGAPVAKVATGARKGRDCAFAQVGVRGDTRFQAPGVGPVTVYLVIKAGADGDGRVDVTIDQVSLTDTSTGEELVANGGYGSAAGWSEWHHAGKLSADYACTDNTPAGGSGPALRLTGGSVNGGVYQALSLVGGRTYTLNGVCRDVNSSPYSAWVEVFLRTDPPVEGRDCVGKPGAGSEIDLNTSTAEEIERYFRSLSGTEYVVYEQLRRPLTAGH